MTKQAFIWTHLQHIASMPHNTSLKRHHWQLSQTVNKYPSTSQTTQYNFLGPGTTAEICSGIVKATPQHSKRAAQHFHDLNELRPILMYKQLFSTASLEWKTNVFVRVDGCHDEGPTHKEVQFWWTSYYYFTPSKHFFDLGYRWSSKWKWLMARQR